jgi:hypothetical protein
MEVLLQINQPQRQTLSFIKPDTARIVKQLDDLIGEWRAWEKEVDKLPEHHFNPLYPIHFNVLEDGEENLKSHRILQEKTLVFLENNIVGHGFICGRDGSKIDRTDLPLKIRVKHRIDDLDELRACLQYANVPETYWKAKAKEMLAKTVGKAPDIATDIAAKNLTPSPTARRAQAGSDARARRSRRGAGVDSCRPYLQGMS